MNKTSYVIANMNELFEDGARTEKIKRNKQKKNHALKIMLAHTFLGRLIHIQSYW